MYLVLNALGFPKPSMRVLHLAPEQSLYGPLREALGKGYETADFNPRLYPYAKGIRKIDLTSDLESLPTSRYDAIIHMHVMEHIPCNITAVMFHLHRALKPDGMQLVSVPIFHRPWEEYLGPLSPEEATRRFSQYDHVRRFGAADLQATLGMIFDLPEQYDLSSIVPEEKLRAYGFEENHWRGWSSNSIMVLPKKALKLDLDRYQLPERSAKVQAQQIKQKEEITKLTGC